MRLESLAYLLGMMLGDAGKPGGVQERFTSVSLDLQLSEKETPNQRLGEFVCMCANSLGIRMGRTLDKKPTGNTRNAEEPTPAYRWLSSRSALLAWMFQVCLGLRPGELTSAHQIRMEWISLTPFNFRKRFAQGIADSDGTARKYTVDIASMPNAEFVTSLLAGLGMASAHTLYEHGKAMRSSISNREAAKLPIFSEFAKGYRYQRLMNSV